MDRALLVTLSSGSVTLCQQPGVYTDFELAESLSVARLVNYCA